MEHADMPVTVRTVLAGKLRRYHGVAWYKQLLDGPTTFRNTRDIFLIAAGFFQSLWLLLRDRPDVVFAKGGYVCLPVGMAAALLKIPLVIHDSDTRPGLTNRVLARWAVRIGTGAPLNNYPYPKGISHYVGVPIDPAFRPFSESQKTEAKAALGIIDLTKPLVVITGGGLGAKSINDAVVAIAQRLLATGIALYHVTGKKNYDFVRSHASEHADYHIVPFIYKDMPVVLGAADVVVSRGSATFSQELAALAKPTVLIPAGHLGDQVKNAGVFGEAEAAIILSDADIADPNVLYEAIVKLMEDEKYALRLAKNFHAFARPDAALDVARLIVEAVAAPRQKESTR
jgi:UDP-N-acetylglucosamine--N-acetylmuramyl-(pentapeptide) pyrophosphoryl-undecaprenol N-acetylglucosamine transferase